MLRANRLLGADQRLRSGREFARAFAADSGRDLAPSQITRWERGDLPVNRTVLRCYERLLGLPELTLTTVSDAVHRFYGDLDDTGARRYEGDVRVTETAVSRRWHDLLAQARVPYAMTGAAWDELTAEIGRRPGLVLHPPTLWDEMCHHLLGELVVAEGREWLLRQEAMSRLLGHPDGGPAAVRTCTAMVDDRAVPVFITPLSLLDATADRRANRYVLDQLDNPHNELAHQGALLAAIRKLRAGHFRTAPEWRRLTAAARGLLAGSGPDPEVQALSGELLTGMARLLPHENGLRAQLAALHHDGGPALPQGVPADPGVLVDNLVRRARGLLPVEPPEADDVFPALIAEAMHSPNADLRLYSVMLVAATPYRWPLASAALGEMQGRLKDWGPGLVASTLRMLTLLKTPDHRELVYGLLVDPAATPPLRHAAASATPHWRARMDAGRWQRVLAAQRQQARRAPSTLDDGILRALAYGMATDGHRDLLREVEAGSTGRPYPPQAQAIADWWTRLPPQLLAAARR
ncbi:hypothetical protein OG767_10740 [Micromonospora sp. NBC_01392]|uniref:hypothetical protein n=1 Tax=Micromonospora sp. NBC_01392 TaxID=2903588 RepID=UPI003249B1DA